MAADGQTLNDLEARVARLEDERAVLDTLYRYAHTIDARLAEEWVDCFTADAVWGVDPRAGDSGSTFLLRGHAELAAHIARPRPSAELRLKHMLVEPRVVIDGDRCRVESYFVLVEGHPTGPFVRMFGRYRDRLVRGADGRWRFEERFFEVDGTHPNAALLFAPDPL